MFKACSIVAGYLKFHIKKAFLKTKAPVTLDAVHLNDLREKGYTAFENYFDAAKCEELRNAIDQLFVDHKDSEYFWVDPEGADKRIWGAEKLNPLIKSFYEDSFLKEAGESYFGAKLANSNTLAARIDFAPGNIGSGGGWHRDSNHFQFKAIIYLADVSEKNGPFQLFEGSHKLRNVIEDTNIMDSKPLSYRFSEEEIEKLKEKKGETLKTMTGKAGTLLLVDTSTIHRGMPIEDGSRYTLFNYFVPGYYNIDEVRKRLNTIEY